MATSSALQSNTLAESRLHPNLVVGSLQLLLWIMFTPSAWAAFVARIDPTLRPDFTFADLSRQHWQHPLFRRMLLGYMIYMPLVLLVSALTLFIFRVQGPLLLIGLVEPLLVMLCCLALGGTFISVPVGLFLSFPGCLICALRYGLTYEAGYPVQAGFATALVYGVGIGLTGGVGGLIANSVYSRDDEGRSNWASWLSGGGTGAFLGALALFGYYSLLQALVIWLFPAAGVMAGSSWAFWLAPVFLLLLVPVFVAAVGWQRAEVVLMITVGSLVGVALLLLLLRQLAFFEGTATGFTIAIIALMGLPYTVVSRIAGPRIAASTAAMGLGLSWAVWMVLEGQVFAWPWLPLTLLVIVLGATIAYWGPLVLHPFFETWNMLLLRRDERANPAAPSHLRWHAAFWNEVHPLPFRSLDDYILLVAGRNPAEAQAAIEQLSASRYQRRAAQSAQIELYRRDLGEVQDVEAIARVAQTLSGGELDSPVSPLLRTLGRIGQTVRAALNSTTLYHRRLALRMAEENLETLLRDMTLSSDAYTARFRPIVARWRQLLAEEGERLARQATENQRIDNPYIVGIPLADDQELFVGRADVAARIEQIIVDRRRPPLLLYGQRRMGKTSLLHNLGRLLPDSTVLLFVDGEGISGAVDYADFLYALASTMARSAEQHRRLSLPAPDRQALEAHPFTAFSDWLTQVERLLERQGRTALLALDEFEALDTIIGRGRFDASDMMRTLRSLIQHRPRFKVLLAGSHTIDEFRHWASQLINLQVIKIGYLEPNDALALIENPVQGFALRYESAASQRVLALTRGHPYLVQLLCSEVVHLKNDGPAERRLLVTEADVEEAVPHALMAGDMFFADMANQAGDTGEALLRSIAAAGEGATVARAALASIGGTELDEALALLLRRDAIERDGEGYRFQVELIRRWFAA